MRLFALSDPHLAFSVSDKKMDRFGEIWIHHPDQIKLHWSRLVTEADVVLLPGDISWAKRFGDALADLHWLDALPGQKIILKGNHDFWWPKKGAFGDRLPSSFHVIRHDSLRLGNFLFFGTRLWDTREYSCNDLVEWDPKKGDVDRAKTDVELARQEVLYERELDRLAESVATLPSDPSLVRIGLCHFPPLNHRLEPSRASALFERAGARHVVFGHLHSVKTDIPAFGDRNGTGYHLTSSDFLGFRPKLIA